MAIYIQISTFTPTVTNGVEPAKAFGNLMAVTNNPMLGTTPASTSMDKVTLPLMTTPAAAARVSQMVNNSYNVPGAGMTDTLIVPVLDNFLLNTTSIKTVGGATYPPTGSGLLGSPGNPMYGFVNSTAYCVIFYDTTVNSSAGYCVSQGGQHNLDMPAHVMLYHELCHAWYILQNFPTPTTQTCNPAPIEEQAIIGEENVYRTQKSLGLRDLSDGCAYNCPSPPPPPPCCCIVVTVASRSQNSPELQALRALRDGVLRRSEVGFDFFERLHYDYYAFSPQVCTLIAGEPRMPPLILEGYVRPLLTALRALQAYALDSSNDAALGRAFLDEVGDADQRERSLAAGRRAARFWNGSEPSEDEVGRRLAAFLHEHAWPSDYVQWGLVEPVRIYLEALERAGASDDAGTVGASLREAFEDWGPRLPIGHVWASLPADRLAFELDWLDRFLLKTEAARTAFRRRLRDRFGDIPPVADLFAAAPVAPGGRA